MTKRDWNCLGLSEHSLEAIEQDFKFKRPSPVQYATIPHFLNYKDCCVKAITGSGKTLAFILPLFEILNRIPEEDAVRESDICGMVISPTRELAKQTSEVAAIVANRFKRFKSCLVTGGQTHEDCKELVFKNGNVVVGTPGRLVWVCTLKIRFKHFNVLILDEADRLLQMGFWGSINTIIAKLPRQRRTALFSATLENTDRLVRAGLRNPLMIDVQLRTKSACPNALQSSFLTVNVRDRVAALFNAISARKRAKNMVFLTTTSQVDYFHLIAENIFRGLRLFKIHGKVNQKKRFVVQKEFRELKSGTLFTTDVSSRGMDYPDVDNIIQFEAPKTVEHFIHRAGRSARMGKRGKSLLFMLEHEEEFIQMLRDDKVEIADITECSADYLYSPWTASSLVQKIRKLIPTDRALLEKGPKAFVSFVRSYREHVFSSIFRLSKINLGHLATSYGLIYLPKFKEKFIVLNEEDFEAPTVVLDLPNIKFKNRARQKQREANIKRSANRPPVVIKPKVEKKKYVRKGQNLSFRKRRRFREWREYEELGKELKSLKKQKKYSRERAKLKYKYRAELFK